MFTEKQINELANEYSCGEDNLGYAFADGFKKAMELIELFNAGMNATGKDKAPPFLDAIKAIDNFKIAKMVM